MVQVEDPGLLGWLRSSVVGAHIWSCLNLGIAGMELLDLWQGGSCEGLGPWYGKIALGRSQTQAESASV